MPYNNSKSSSLHPRNKHINGYDFDILIKSLPELKQHTIITKASKESIDFANPDAVKTLNKALLKVYYNVDIWDIPDGYLCPPVPGRADYIHHVADLLATSNNGIIPSGSDVKILDIGTGANCIYSLIGHREYGWSFVGTEIDKVAIANAQLIINQNKLNYHIDIIEQPDRNKYFDSIIKSNEKYYAVVCNPPFNASMQEAIESNTRKVQNLNGSNAIPSKQNFGGQGSELWTRGGEVKFIRRMIAESVIYKDNVQWFTSLVSKSDSLKPIYKEFELQQVKFHKTIEMAHGNKVSRFVAWTFIPQ